MNIIISIFHNTTLMAAVLSWFIAQIIKTIIVLIQTKAFVPERLFGAGGMPSAHSALVCSLFMCVAHERGLASPEFAIAFCFAMVIIYDAMGIRRAAGEQAKAINRMSDIFEKEGVQVNQKDLKEYLGHTPLEVLGGVLLGIIVALVMI